MIKLEVINDDHNQFLIKANEPIRIEVMRANKQGDILAYVYKGTRINLNQRPCAIYDGTLCKPPFDGNDNILVKSRKK